MGDGADADVAEVALGREELVEGDDLQSDARVGENARVLAYTVNEDAVRHAKRLIDARQYVLRSRWQDVQPRAREQNAFLRTHSWEEYAAWHLGLTGGADEGGGRATRLSTATSAVCTGWG